MDTTVSHQTIYKREPEIYKEKRKVEQMVESSKRVLCEISSVFPFDLFTDKVIVEEKKVNIIYGLFILSEKIISIPITAINNCAVSTGYMFATLNIEIEGFNENPQRVSHIWIEDAKKAARCINGLILCHKQGIDLTKLDIDYVKKKVEEIGRAS